MEGGWGLVWNSSFGSMISHTHSTEIRFLVVFNTTPVLYIMYSLIILVAIFGQIIIRDM
jgi:hypothetical protein